MPDCHKCSLNGHPNRRCIKCPGPSIKPANHGQHIVSLETMPPKEIARLKYIPPEPESPMAEFMRTWLRLPSKTRDLISFAISARPKSCAEIARQAGVSRQYVHRKLVEAARSFPALTSVLHLRVRAATVKLAPFAIKKG